MDGWMNVLDVGWIDGWVDRWMDERMDGCGKWWTSRCMSGWIYKWMDGLMGLFAQCVSSLLQRLRSDFSITRN